MLGQFYSKIPPPDVGDGMMPSKGLGALQCHGAVAEAADDLGRRHTGVVQVVIGLAQLTRGVREDSAFVPIDLYEDIFGTRVLAIRPLPDITKCRREGDVVLAGLEGEDFERRR